MIAPAGPEGDALIAALRRLITARGEQQAAPVREYRVSPRMRAGEAARWRKQVVQASERDAADLPPATREPELAAIEAAIGDLLLGTAPVASVARRRGLDPRALAELFDRYRRGGRAAIGRS